jgi:hypothetical protein
LRDVAVDDDAQFLALQDEAQQAPGIVDTAAADKMPQRWRTDLGGTELVGDVTSLPDGPLFYTPPAGQRRCHP